MVLIFETEREESWRDKTLPVTSITINGTTSLVQRATISEPTQIFRTAVVFRRHVGDVDSHWEKVLTWSMERFDSNPNREPF